MKKKIFLVLLIALCAVLSSCGANLPSEDDGFYDIGEEITLRDSRNGEAIAVFKVEKVQILNEDIKQSGVEKEHSAVGISYKVIFEEENYIISSKNFKVTDSNGKEAIFIRQSGISGDDRIEQTLVYAVESVDEHVDIAFSLNQNEEPDLLIRANRGDLSYDFSYDQSAEEVFESEEFGFISGKTVHFSVVVISVIMLSVTAVVLLIAEIVFRKKKNKPDPVSASQIDGVQTPTVEEQPGGMNGVKKAKKKSKWFFGACSLLWSIVPGVLLCFIVLLVALISSPSNFLLMLILSPMIFFVGFVLLPWTHVLSSTFGIISGSISIRRGEARWLAYTSVILNALIYIFALLMSLLAVI